MLGSILFAIGVVIAIAGTGVLTAGILGTNAGQLADSDGFISAPRENFSTQTYALTSPSVGEITVNPRGLQNLPFDIATVRLQATSAGSDVFIGIAPEVDIERYLAGVERAEIRNLQYFPFRVDYREIVGTHAATPPADENFWTESATGPGTQEIQWSVAPGEWGVVVMNADGSPGVNVDLQPAARSDLIVPIATLLIVIGAVLLIIGISLIVGGAISLGRRTRTARIIAPGQRGDVAVGSVHDVGAPGPRSDVATPGPGGGEAGPV